MSFVFVFLLVLMALALIVLIVFLFMGVGMYNRLVALRNAVKAAFAQIEVQLQRRHDLIPNLVEVAKKYMAHERETLEAVIAARNAAVTASNFAQQNGNDPKAIPALAQAEGNLSGVLGRLFALSESYPDLKADTQMSQLMTELSETEDKVSFSRQAYNNEVMQYNTQREVFPSVVIAKLFHFEASTPYEVENQQVRQAPEVKF